MYYAVNAGYNPELNLPWVELKEFESYEEAEKYSESLELPRFVDPLELLEDYESSIKMLKEEYGYPSYAIKDIYEG